MCYCIWHMYVIRRLMFVAIDGNSLDKLRHTRSVAYSVELVLLNKHQISGGGAYPDCYPIDRLSHKTCSL